MTQPRTESDSSARRIERRLAVAFVVTVLFMVIEALGGWLSGSLALIADAGHMLTDALSLSLAFAGFWFGRRPADARRSYGYRRFEVLAAWVNGLILAGLSIWIMVEAALRLNKPVPVLGGPMLVVATAGLLVNLFILWWLRREHADHINMRGAILHVMSDLLGSIGAMLAAGVILATGWTPADPILSLLISLLILRSAFMLVRSATHILLEGTPDDLDLDELRADMARAVPDIAGIHHIHAWSLTSGRPMLTLHVSLVEGADREKVLRAVKERLLTEYRIDHSVVQVESGECPDAPSAAGKTGIAVGALLAAVLSAATPAAAEESVTVFAAASLTDAVGDIAKSYEVRGARKIVASFASSATLARQITHGAPAEIFISADERWMDALESRDLLEAGSRANLLHNTLVLIAPAAEPISVAIEHGFPLADHLRGGRLAMGDPDSVPAGIYGKEALLNLGVWDSVADKVAPAADVRAALVFVERGETPAGIVYATDAAASAKVMVAGRFPEDSHAPIVYPIALIRGAGTPARDFYEYLRGGAARAIFERYGFTVQSAGVHADAP